jgi:hypothetical protein
VDDDDADDFVPDGDDPADLDIRPSRSAAILPESACAGAKIAGQTKAKTRLQPALNLAEGEISAAAAQSVDRAARRDRRPRIPMMR